MKKVVHVVIFEYYHEGYSYQENLLSQKHKELGYDVYIIAAEDDGTHGVRSQILKPGKYINEYGIKVYVLPTKKINPHLMRFSDKCVGLYDALEEIQPDIVFVHNFRAWDVRHVARYIKMHPHTGLYVDSHADYFNAPTDSFKGKIDALEISLYGRVLSSKAIKFWGTLPWRVKYLQEAFRIPAEKTDLLIMGADENKIHGLDGANVRSKIRHEFKIPEDAFLVVSGGRLDKRKNQIALCEAISRLSDRNIYLLLFGSPSEDMANLFKNFEGYDNIKQIGWQPSDRAYEFFLSSDLACFPGTHSVLWEQAVACGCPLLVKYWEGITHINFNGNAVLLDNPNAENLYEKIIAISESSAYKELKEKSIEAAPHFYLKEIALQSIGED